MYWFFWSFFYEGDKDLKKKRRSLAREANRGNLDSAFQLAKDAYRSNHSKLAETLFLMVYKGPSYKWHTASLYLGTIYHNRGRDDMAQHYWLEAANNGEPDTVKTALYNLGMMHKKWDQIGPAIGALEEASSLGHQKAKEALAVLKARPAPRYNMSPRDAEIVAAQWMVHWGFYDAKATPVGPDGGIDVISSEALAQVKYRTSKTGLTEINEFHGSAEGSGKYELFFSREGFSQKAIDRANEKDIALFVFNHEGVPKPLNDAARAIAARGK